MGMMGEMDMLAIIQEYLESSYLTLMILATLIVMLFTNRNVMIKGKGLIYVVAGLILLVSVLEYVEEWCDAYDKSYRILYYKAAGIYTLYPLIILLLLFLAGDVKHKLLIALPELINVVFVFVDVSGTTGFVYYYGVDHGYLGGPLNWLPIAVEIFYLLLLGIYSYRLLKFGKRALGNCVIFMTVCCLLSIALTNEGIIGIQTVPAVVALELLVYYFYLFLLLFVYRNHRILQERTVITQQDL